MDALGPILVDCSVWVPALRAHGGEAEKQRVAALLAGGRAAVTEIILLELWRGAKPGREQERVAELARDLPLLGSTPAVWQRSNELARRCRKSGFLVPLGDLLVAACAWEYGVTIEQRDIHFEQIQSVLPEGKRILFP